MERENVCIICREPINEINIANHSKCLGAECNSFLITESGYLYPRTESGFCLVRDDDGQLMYVSENDLNPKENLEEAGEPPNTIDHEETNDDTVDEQSSSCQKIWKKSRLPNDEIRLLENLIDEVEKHRCLYDITLPTKLRGPKSTGPAWRKIAEHLNVPGWTEVAIKKKWKNLRDTFRRKIKVLPSGAEAPEDNDFVDDWPFTHRLMFLRCFEQDPSATVSNLMVRNVQTNKENTKNYDDNGRASPANEISRPDSQSTPLSSRTPALRDKNNSACSSRKNKGADDECTRMMSETIAKIATAIESPPPLASIPIPVSDPLDGFFEYIKPMMSKLRDKKRRKVVRDILNVIEDAMTDDEDD